MPQFPKGAGTFARATNKEQYTYSKVSFTRISFCSSEHLIVFFDQSVVCRRYSLFQGGVCWSSLKERRALEGEPGVESRGQGHYQVSGPGTYKPKRLTLGAEVYHGLSRCQSTIHCSLSMEREEGRTFHTLAMAGDGLSTPWVKEAMKECQRGRKRGEDKRDGPN